LIIAPLTPDSSDFLAGNLWKTPLPPPRELLAENNIVTLSAAAGFKRIVTTDPHSFNTSRNEYPGFGGGYEIVHYTQMVLALIRAGRIQIDRPLSYRVTITTPVTWAASTRSTTPRARSSGRWAASWSTSHTPAGCIWGSGGRA
jgi:hypothetical protein